MTEEEKQAAEALEAEKAAAEAAKKSEEGEGDELTPEELKAQLAEEKEARKKADELAANQKIRAEKAEKLNKGKVGEEKKPVVAETPSITDIYALSNAKVAEEDVPEVQRFAKFQGITIAEALKSPVIKGILAEKAEFRKTAAATSTGRIRTGTVKATDDDLLSEASKGNLPDSDEDIRRISLARLKRRGNKK